MNSKYTEEMNLKGKETTRSMFVKLQDGSTYEVESDNLTFTDYQLQADLTAGKHQDSREEILNWTLGLAGESGEFANLIKKAIFHQHGFNYGEIVSELGDCLWYISQLCTSLGIDMGMVAEQNNKKLARRYPKGFTSEDSINRSE